MLARILGLFRSAPPTGVGVHAPEVTSHPQGQASRGQPVVYPPQDPGLVCRSADDLLLGQAEILNMLRIHSAAKHAVFQQRFEEPLRRLAAYVSNLPGSASCAFAGEGGLFRASIECAFLTFRAADGRIFTGDKGVEDRHRLEERWRYVCFAAGLLYPLGASLSAMQVLNEKGAAWAPEFEGLTQWCGHENRYYVTWSDEGAEPGPASLAAMLVNTILGRENINWLNAGAPDLIRSVTDIVSGARVAVPTIAAAVIEDIWKSIHERETARRHQNYGRLLVGSHISPYVIDAMVVLSKSAWKVNEQTLYADREGVYLQWPEAAQDIIGFCAERGYRGIPASEGGLLTMMVSNKIIQAGADGLSMHEIADQNGEILRAIRLSKPGLLLDDPKAFMQGRAVAVNAIMAADPLQSPSPEHGNAEKKRRAPKQQAAIEGDATPPPAAPAAAAPVMDMLDIGEFAAQQAKTEPGPAEGSSTAATALAVASADSKPQPAAEPNASASQQPGRKDANGAGAARSQRPDTRKGADQQRGPAGANVEGAVVDLGKGLPPEITGRLKAPSAEALGKVISDWKNKAFGDYVLRMTTLGLAVQSEYLMREVSTRTPDLISDWASVGLLYIDQARPGVKVHNVATVDGGQEMVGCVILSGSTVRRLGLATGGSAKP